jgi:hypothetical protein
MQQTMVNMQAAQPQVLPPRLRDRLGDFQRTKPPTFSQAVEPMDADDWLKSVEKKLQVVQCNNREKVLLASPREGEQGSCAGELQRHDGVQV